MARSACAYAFRPSVRLTVYLHDGRVLSGVYWRAGAALRLRAARRLPLFKDYKLEAYQ